MTLQTATELHTCRLPQCKRDSNAVHAQLQAGYQALSRTQQNQHVTMAVSLSDACLAISQPVI